MEKGVPVSVWPEWQLVEKIGEGSFGKVYKAQRTERGRTFYSAIKIISIPGNKGELDSVRSEMNDEQSTREYFRNLVEDCVQEYIRWSISAEIPILYPLKILKWWNIWTRSAGIFTSEWNI